MFASIAHNLLIYSLYYLDTGLSRLYNINRSTINSFYGVVGTEISATAIGGAGEEPAREK
jgi:hypothetical protein